MGNMTIFLLFQLFVSPSFGRVAGVIPGFTNSGACSVLKIFKPTKPMSDSMKHFGRLRFEQSCLFGVSGSFVNLFCNTFKFLFR
eukprot:1155248-Amphidinium_carterae.1